MVSAALVPCDLAQMTSPAPCIAHGVERADHTRHFQNKRSVKS